MNIDEIGTESPYLQKIEDITKAMSIRKIIVDYALQFVGRPYRWGGDDPMGGYDCSGFVQELLAAIGCDPPGDQTAHSLYEHFYKDAYKKEHPQEPPSLIFYGSRYKVSHCAMFLDNKHIIEATGAGRKVKTEKDAEKYNAYIRVRPYFYRTDIVSILSPLTG